MLSTPRTPPGCSLYLISPVLSVADSEGFAGVFAEVVAAAGAACALVRLAAATQADAKSMVAPLLRAARASDCALLIENDGELAARLGADGVHINGAGADLVAAVESLKPDRIVGAGSLRTRDEAMTAGEWGADYVMFGGPRRGAPAMKPRSLAERVGWWAEIFETPCVAYADTIAAVGALADAGADFVALGEAIWRHPSPTEAAREARAQLAGVSAEEP
ncbi:MAG TPA: thiamine phosphate synthase [Roseiarcus sp.]|jgi:thiamine-phosphate pyrophosphorylase|nr:thiamine phosphate synthase [Roseiarcus sp.]